VSGNFPSGSAGLDLQKGNLRPALGCVGALPFEVADPRNLTFEWRAAFCASGTRRLYLVE